MKPENRATPPIRGGGRSEYHRAGDEGTTVTRHAAGLQPPAPLTDLAPDGANSRRKRGRPAQDDKLETFRRLFPEYSRRTLTRYVRAYRLSLIAGVKLSTLIRGHRASFVTSGGRLKVAALLEQMEIMAALQTDEGGAP
jgi:hypothetical protein